MSRNELLQPKEMDQNHKVNSETLPVSNLDTITEEEKIQTTVNVPQTWVTISEMLNIAIASNKGFFEIYLYLFWALLRLFGENEGRTGDQGTWIGWGLILKFAQEDTLCKDLG